jgi:ABC-type molybdenum transport system ATPase subunit/photorepair protein PhrA
MSDILLTLDNIGLVRDERAILRRIQLTVRVAKSSL